MISAVLLSVALVTGGKPAATIVVPEKPTLNEGFAAGELQYWVKEITGAELPIAVAQERNPPGVYIGRRFAEGRLGELGGEAEGAGQLAASARPQRDPQLLEQSGPDR